MTTFLQQSALHDIDKSAAWKLFTYRYPCRVRQIHLTPEWVFSDYGVISSGDRAVDAQLMNEWMDVYLTPVDMALIIGQGVSIIVTNPEACVHIYKLITEHLNDWVDALTNNPHINRGPIDDLKLFDELASIVWTIARNYITEEVGTSHLMARLNSFYVNPIGNRGIVKRVTTIEQDHKTVTGDLVKLTAKTNRYWGRS